MSSARIDGVAMLRGAEGTRNGHPPAANGIRLLLVARSRRAHTSHILLELVESSNRRREKRNMASLISKFHGFLSNVVDVWDEKIGGSFFKKRSEGYSLDRWMSSRHGKAGLTFSHVGVTERKEIGEVANVAVH